MKKQPDKDVVKEPAADYGMYTYADYLSWQLDEMAELIREKVFGKVAVSRVIHQRIS